MNLFASEPAADVAALWEALRKLAGGGGSARAIQIPPGLETFAALYRPVAAPRWAPFVIGQLGQSLDGYIATLSGASHYVTGPQSLVHLHRLRALCDTVVVGWRTVAADDPQLTVRHVPGENPLRVAIDLAGQLSSRHAMFSAEPPGVLRITGPGIPAMDGIETVEVPIQNGRCSPADVIALLTARGCRRILVEGGGAIVSAFIAAGLVDRLHLAVAPLITGEGIRGLTLPPVRALSEAIRPLSRQISMGRDTLFDLELRDGQ